MRYCAACRSAAPRQTWPQAYAGAVISRPPEAVFDKAAAVNAAAGFRVVLVVLAAAAAKAAVAQPVPELEQRLDRVGAAQLVQELGGEGLAALHRRAAACELAAVSFTLRLAREADPPAPHVDALRLANGRCPRYVLAIAAHDEVARVCASLASWGPAQTARELRRRIAAIEADPLLGASAQGRACRDAYWYELRNTRVVLKRKA